MKDEKSRPDVGVVMPVYVQRHDYLRIALSTILAQSYRDFVLVVVVDGAPDDILAVIKEETSNDPRVEILIKETNEGTAKALNTGFERLAQIDSVKYLTWVSSDNLHYPSFLDRLRLALVEASGSVGLAYSSFYYIDAEGKRLESLQPDMEAFRRYQNQPKDRLIEYSFVGTSFMYKKRYATLIGGYQMEPVEDAEYWLRLSEVCELQYVSEELIEFRYMPPLSRSLEIHSSKQGQRELIYMFNLARQQARIRQGISVETTIIFPIEKLEDARESFERLLGLGQPYSNFRLLVVDLGAQSSLATELEEFRDPRMSCSTSDVDGNTAIRRLAEGVDTTFTLLYRPGCLPKRADALAQLPALHRSLADFGVSRVVSTYHRPVSTSKAARVKARIERIAERIGHVLGIRVAEPTLNVPPHLAYETHRRKHNVAFGRLYRTDELLAILGRKR